MKPKNIMDAINGIDYDMVEAAEKTHKASKRSWSKWIAAAACAVLVIGTGAFFLAKTPAVKDPGAIDTSNGHWIPEGRYRYPVSGEIATAWPWEYKTSTERWEEMSLEGKAYRTRTREIGESLLGEALGVCLASGYDIYTETSYSEAFEVRAIRGVDPEALVAVDLEGTWVVFLREELPIPATLGDWMDICSLPETVSLAQFSTIEGYQTTAWYLADSDEELWRILSTCRSAPGSVDDWGLGDRSRISFTVSSEALGVSKKVLSITEDGYLLTNLMEYGYVYNIGKAAAQQIISSVTEYCKETELEPYFQMIAGVLTEIGDGYVLIDDTVLCKNEADGLVYKVLMDDTRIRRCLDFPGDIALGDIVVVEYEGTLDFAHENTITGAFFMTEAIMKESGAEVPE